MNESKAKSYLEDLFEKCKTEIPELIKNKYANKKNSLYGLFREAFGVAKLLLHSLIDQYRRQCGNGECGLHWNGTLLGDLAIHKFQQAELFFIKCALKISNE